jgi:ribosomal protein S12 methylthiotransferase
LLWEARLATQAPEIDGVCYINDVAAGEHSMPRVGEFRLLRVTEAHDYDLVGELVNPPESSFAPARLAANPFPILPSAPQANVPAIR